MTASIGNGLMKGRMTSVILPLQMPMSVAIVGVGGYAGHICDSVARLSAEDASTIRFVSITDPCPAVEIERVERLKRSGVSFCDSLEKLLETPCDIVWLPIPIHLHRSFAERCLAAGKKVICEKPAAGVVQDVDAMIAARDRAGQFVAVGFQHIYDPNVIRLKQAIVSGKLGKLKHSTLIGCWPRSGIYYSRNSWAGKLKVGDDWIIDSPASNALAHYINLATFLMGPVVEDSAVPTRVTSQLCRANAIESYDTCAMRIEVAGGAQLLVYLTHACQKTIEPIIEMTFENGTLRYQHGKTAVLSCSDGQSQTFPMDSSHAINIARVVARKLSDPTCTDPIATLEMARQHTVIVNGAYESAMVGDVPQSEITHFTGRDKAIVQAIKDIEPLFSRCAAELKLPAELDAWPWAPLGEAIDLTNYTHFPQFRKP